MTPPYDPSGSPVPPSGVWPPPPGGFAPSEAAGENTSGMRGAVPPQIAALRWNWGAFLLSFLWTVNHKMAWGWGILVLSLLSAIPLVGGIFSLANLGIAIYLGAKGHQLGWQNRRFEGGLTQYFAVQNVWLKWGVVIGILSFALGILGLIGEAISRSSAHLGPTYL